MKQNAFPSLLYAFFHEWAGKERNLSAHTVRSYRDTWRLFLRFVSERKKRAVDALLLTDFATTEVRAFLQYMEETRKVSIGTRNLSAGCHPQLLCLCGSTRTYGPCAMRRDRPYPGQENEPSGDDLPGNRRDQRDPRST